MIIYIVQVIYR